MKLPDLFGMQMDLEWITARLESGEKGTKEESWMSFRFLPWMVPLGNVGRCTGLRGK